MCNSDSVFKKHLKTFLFNTARLTAVQRLDLWHGNTNNIWHSLQRGK